MSDIRLSGLASGIDTNSLIAQLIRLERRPIDNIQNNIAKNNRALDALRNLNTKFQALETAAKKVQELQNFAASATNSTKVADLSSNGIVGVGSIDTAATLGEYQVSVKSLATKQVIGGPAQLDSNGDVNGLGANSKLKLLSKDGTELASVDLGVNKSIFQVATLFNADAKASELMTASVVGGQLIFTSKHAGAAFNYTVAVYDSPGAGGASQDYNLNATRSLGLLDPSTNVIGTDASVEVTKPDGTLVPVRTNTSTLTANAGATAAPYFTITESSNTFAVDATTDLDFKIFANGIGDTSFFIRDRDLSGVNGASANDSNTTVGLIRDMVSKYNDLIKQIKADTAYNTATRTGGPLMGDAIIGRLQYDLNNALTDPFTTYAGSNTPPTPDTGLGLIGAANGPGAVHNNNTLKGYSTVGLRVQADGTVSIDEKVLQDALNNNPNDVRRLFAFEDYQFDANNVAQINKGTASTFGDGIATRLMAIANRNSSPVSPYNGVLASGQRAEGTILTRISSFNRQNTSLNDNIKRVERRVEQREKLLRLQFQNMEKIVSGLRTQGNYLQGQLGGLGG